MSGQFRVRFSRYRAGERRQSNALFVQADDFGQALRIAESVVTGMKSGDPAFEYQVASIDTVGLQGVDCSGGGFLFETAEEFSARVNADLSPLGRLRHHVSGAVDRGDAVPIVEISPKS